MKTQAKSKTPEYRAWSDIKQRCNNPRCKAYAHYGARGISICERWLVFDNFLHDMGPRPDGMSIDRIDVNGNYEPANCRWATPATQSRNLQVHTEDDVGVFFSNRDNTWSAFITVNRRSIRVGSFPEKADAIAARKLAEVKYWQNNEPPPQKSSLQRNNTSGFRGVSLNRKHKYWESYFYKDRKRTLIGRFKTIEQAIEARRRHDISAHGITQEKQG